MRRKPLAARARPPLRSARAWAECPARRRAGVGAALDRRRVLPNPEIAMWAPAPRLRAGLWTAERGASTMPTGVSGGRTWRGYWQWMMSGAILDALARVLGRDGHEVVKAADPTAVPGTDLSRFDLVLCDVMMPGLDGFELVRQIRPDFDGPIIFLTARVAEEDAVAGYGLGADDYVPQALRGRGAARQGRGPSTP